MARITVFQTSILTNPALRKRHETVEMALMPFVAETEMRDLASDEQAKETWKRVRGTNMELPCILVDGKRVGSIEELQEAMEDGAVKQFLGLDKPPAPEGGDDAALDADLSNLSPAEAEALAKELEQQK